MTKGVRSTSTLVSMPIPPYKTMLGTCDYPKIAFFAHFRQILKHGCATREARCRSPQSSFSLKLWVIVVHTHRYHAPKFQANPKHHDGRMIFPHFAPAAACLLAAAAKRGRSTLDTKKGYKTKSGSTSSVTLVLTPTLALPLALAPTLGSG